MVVRPEEEDKEDVEDKDTVVSVTTTVTGAIVTDPPTVDRDEDVAATSAPVLQGRLTV